MKKKAFHAMIATTLFVLALASEALAGENETEGAVGDSRVEETGTPAVATPDALPEHPNHRRFNVRMAAGADFALGDALSKRHLGEFGGQGVIGIDWILVDPLAFSILVGYSAFSPGDEGALQDLFATVGFQLRLFPDRKGALGERGGNPWGHLFVDGHFGYHSYESQEHAGYNVGLGYEFSLARDFNLGPYVRFTHVPIGDGFSYMSMAFGVQVSVGGKFGPDDADGDAIEDNSDRCPMEVEDIDNFEDEDGCPDMDNDKDGVSDADDKCPETAGVPTNAGCPETDNDHDGVLNDDDACIDEAEDKDGFEDEDGCPDPDNDADGLADDLDKCPTAPEDKDGFEDEDGCPDKDNDEDGIRDTRDHCPLLPESINHVDDKDGCPDFVRFTETGIELLKGVSFEKNKAVIVESSHPMLKEIATLLKLKQETNLRIEGHTDNQSGEKKSAKLSLARAEAVKAFLVAEGIDAQRLSTEGIGQARPIDDNKAATGREKNNRIELHFIKPMANDDPPSTTPDAARAEEGASDEKKKTLNGDGQNP